MEMTNFAVTYTFDDLISRFTLRHKINVLLLIFKKKNLRFTKVFLLSESMLVGESTSYF